MAIATGYLIKGNSASPVGATDSGVAVGTISDTFTPTTYLYPKGVVAPNFGPGAGDGSGYYIRKTDGTPQIVLTLNDANNLDVGIDGGITYIGFKCSLIIRKGKVLSIESQDISQDLYVLQLDTSDNLHVGNATFAGSSLLNDSYFDVQTGKSQFWTEAGVKTASLVASKFGIRAGLSVAPVFCNVGGALFDDYTDAATTSTDGTEDDLYSHTVLASTLASNGDKIAFNYTLTTVASATATRKIKVYFAGTAVFDSTAQVTASAAVAVISGELERVSATVVRCSVVPSIPGMAIAPAPAYVELTGLTLSANTILKLTGAAAGTGAAASNIVARKGSTFYTPAATPLAVPLSLFPTAWFKADAGTYQTQGGTAATANNDPIGYWVDQGLNGHSIAQATAGNRPLLKTNYQNSLPAVLCDGINDVLAATFTLNQPISIYAVIKVVSAVANGNPIAGQNDASIYLGGGGNQLYAYAGQVGGGGQSVTVGTVYTFRALFNGASSATALNSGSPTTGDAGGTNFAGLAIGSKGNGTSPANVAVMEVLVFDRVLSGAEETVILDYLRTRWNHY